MSHVQIYTTPRIESHASVGWYAESLCVYCTVEYSRQPLPGQPSYPLRDEIDRQFNIRAPTYRIDDSWGSISLDSEKRLIDLDFRTDPADWLEQSRPHAGIVAGTPHLEPILDDRGEFSGLGEPEIFYEREKGTLYLSWGSVTRWYAVASSIALGATSDGQLRQIRLDGLFVPKPEPKPAGGFHRLLQKL